MGYFSQRKRREREKIFLSLITIVLGFYTFFLFFQSEDIPFLSEIRQYLFQAYVINIIAFVFALLLGRVLCALFLSVYGIIAFFILSAQADIFFSPQIKTSEHFRLEYQKTTPLVIKAKGQTVLRSGHLNLLPTVQANFVTFDKNKHIFTAIDVNFAGLGEKERRKAFRQLKTFITMQDNPVIVVGDFGETPWSRSFNRFLQQTNLRVKNKIMLMDDERRFNPFALPSFYVLAFSNTMVENIDVRTGDTRPYLQIDVDLSFY